MTYQEQLHTNEWKAKRLLILERDNNRCVECKRERSKLTGLSENFGIKTLEELKSSGYSGFKVDDENKGILVIKQNQTILAHNVGDKNENIEINSMKFALQWNPPLSDNIYAMGRYELICFSKNIEENSQFTDLNIHHKFYIIDNKAWEYENDALITLCANCHQAVHQNTEIFVYAKSGDIMYKTENCKKCNGSGYLHEYNYCQNGVCFSCNGNGVILK